MLTLHATNSSLIPQHPHCPQSLLVVIPEYKAESETLLRVASKTNKQMYHLNVNKNLDTK